jgi:hypothetical protein
VLDKNVGGRPRNGNLFVFDFSFADYIFIPIIYFVVGVILAIPLFFYSPAADLAFDFFVC